MDAKKGHHCEGFIKIRKIDYIGYKGLKTSSLHSYMYSRELDLASHSRMVTRLLLLHIVCTFHTAQSSFSVSCPIPNKGNHFLHGLSFVMPGLSCGVACPLPGPSLLASPSLLPGLFLGSLWPLSCLPQAFHGLYLACPWIYPDLSLAPL
jgi:hypothetical protein